MTRILQILPSVSYDPDMTPQRRRVAFLVVPGATLLDLTGPYEVFTQANACLARRTEGYDLATVSTGPGRMVQTASGLTVSCDGNTGDFPGEIHTLFVTGVPNAVEPVISDAAIGWIRAQAGRVKRLCSVCTGTFFLAQAGALEGRRATTHWEVCDKLARAYPGIRVDATPIFIKDGPVYTSAGISAGMDLALALVEEDFGHAVALEVARQMVLYLKRPGSQAQFSQALTHQQTDNRPVRRICEWIGEHLDDGLTVDALAVRAGMSPRHFARVFVRETGVTPARYVDRMRVETACRRLAETRLSLKQIAQECGWGNPDNMRRVFAKYLGTTPAEYRRNFTSLEQNGQNS